MKTVVCFDLDGTLIDSAAAIHTSLSHACRQAGVSPPSEESIISCIGPPLNEYLPGLLNVSKKKCAAIISAFREHHDCEGYILYKLYPGAETVLSCLAENGNHLYIASSKPYAISHKTLQHFKLTHRFQNIYCPDRSLHPSGLKTHSKAAALAHLKYIYPGAKVVYIGDTLKDKEAAEGADTSFVHASYGYGHGLEADRKIDQLNDLLTLLL